ncbi:MAG: hypothetical protein GX973_01805 [Firmicutes bacterium]|nr:hypothetical protein [Bacillota bacterium]
MKRHNLFSGVLIVLMIPLLIMGTVSRALAGTEMVVLDDPDLTESAYGAQGVVTSDGESEEAGGGSGDPGDRGDAGITGEGASTAGGEEPEESGTSTGEEEPVQIAAPEGEKGDLAALPETAGPELPRTGGSYTPYLVLGIFWVGAGLLLLCGEKSKPGIAK